MDLWISYQQKAFGDYNTKPLLLNTGERHNTSLNMVRDRASELLPSMAVMQSYDMGRRRYIITRDITHDVLISIYDVNSKKMFVARFTRVPKAADWEKMKKRIGTWKNANIELRAIGFQNGSFELLSILKDVKTHTKGNFIEIDLFGTDTRHIALDLKTGASYDLLLLNRLYRTGELTCLVKKEDYDQKRSDLTVK